MKFNRSTVVVCKRIQHSEVNNALMTGLCYQTTLLWMRLVNCLPFTAAYQRRTVGMRLLWEEMEDERRD
jgi:hypothetical protein